MHQRLFDLIVLMVEVLKGSGKGEYCGSRCLLEIGPFSRLLGGTFLFDIHDALSSKGQYFLVSSSICILPLQKSVLSYDC